MSSNECSHFTEPEGFMKERATNNTRGIMRGITRDVAIKATSAANGMSNTSYRSKGCPDGYTSSKPGSCKKTIPTMPLNTFPNYSLCKSGYEFHDGKCYQLNESQYINSKGVVIGKPLISEMSSDKNCKPDEIDMGFLCKSCKPGYKFDENRKNCIRN